MILFLLCGGLLLFTVPYHVSVTPSDSLSYLVGFNNRTAVLILITTSLLFAFLTGGNLGPRSGKDQVLTGRQLLLGIALVVCCCTGRITYSSHHVPAGEAAYFLNRAYLLTSGLSPYSGFEFAYGPALVYLIALLGHAMGHGLTPAYYVCWYCFWIIGTGMLWYVVRTLPFPVSTRRWIFWLLLLTQITSSIWNEGLQYTPVRFACAALLIGLHCRVTRRFDSVWVQSISAGAAVAMALAISPEQAVGTAAGVTCAALRLRTRRADGGERVSRFAQIGSAVAVLACAAWFKLFVTMVPFSRGGYSFPLLPSPSVIAILLIYVAAACAATATFHASGRESSVVPLVIGGAAMLPAAMGRCDLGHLMMAAPALLIGLAFLQLHAKAVKIVCAAELLLIGFPFVLLPAIAFWKAHRFTAIHAVSLQRPASVAVVSQERVLQMLAPCEQVYVSITIAPRLDRSLQEQCILPPYYRGLLDVMTPAQIAGIVQGLRRSPSLPLVLKDVPLEEQFRPVEVNVAQLQLLEASVWVPPIRNSPLTYGPLIGYIQTHYVASGTSGGGMRQWDPCESAACRGDLSQDLHRSSPAVRLQ